MLLSRGDGPSNDRIFEAGMASVVTLYQSQIVSVVDGHWLLMVCHPAPKRDVYTGYSLTEGRHRAVANLQER